MANVNFCRSSNVDELPIIDGQILFDTTNKKIYLDEGFNRIQYGGDTSIIQKIQDSEKFNVFGANATLEIFTQKASVVDSKEDALSVTEEHIPLGCLAFRDEIEDINESFSKLINSLTANGQRLYFDYKDDEFGFNTDINRGADTFHPFSSNRKVYDALVAKGITPISTKTDDIVNAISENVYTAVNLHVAGENGGAEVKSSDKTIRVGETGNYSNAGGHGYYLTITSWNK